MKLTKNYLIGLIVGVVGFTVLWMFVVGKFTLDGLGIVIVIGIIGIIGEVADWIRKHK